MLALLGASRALAQAAPPAPHEDVAFDVMNVLSQHGLHDLDDEIWNAYGQTTYISSWKLPFSAPYTNLNGSPNSLLTTKERSFTWSATLFLGARLWSGAEAYFVPEVIAERALSNLRGIGGAIQNFELQKGGSETPQIYRARQAREQTQRRLLGDLMERAFGGSVKALVLQALASKKSAPEELAAIEELLDRVERRNK